MHLTTSTLYLKYFHLKNGTLTDYNDVERIILTQTNGSPNELCLIWKVLKNDLKAKCFTTFI